MSVSARLRSGRRAMRVDHPTPAVVIGDSVIVGFEHTLDLESCRRLYGASCRGRVARAPATLDALAISAIVALS